MAKLPDETLTAMYHAFLNFAFGILNWSDRDGQVELIRPLANSILLSALIAYFD